MIPILSQDDILELTCGMVQDMIAEKKNDFDEDRWNDQDKENA